MKKALVLQTDFGLGDGAVSAMYGVAYSVSEDLMVADLTHEIPQYDIWEASYRLIQTVAYWPKGTVFVSVVDPGVGSTRRSIAVETVTGQYIITPDNGTLTHVKEMIGIRAARIIDESVNRLPNSGESYTFHGRDVYVYTGARLASGVIDFAGVGPEVDADSVIELPTVDAVYDGEKVCGTIDVLDVRFGSLWTNISRETFQKLGVEYGSRVEIIIAWTILPWPSTRVVSPGPTASVPEPIGESRSAGRRALFMSDAGIGERKESYGEKTGNYI